MFDLKEVFSKHNITVKGAIQAGSHWAEEHQEFVGLGVKKMVYIEPCKAAFKVIEDRFKSNPDTELFNCAVSDYTGVSEMFVSPQNQGQSNSLLSPKKHLEEHKEIVFNERELVTIRRLDDIEFDREQFDFLVMDCQGAELSILKGCVETLKYINVIQTEINRDYVYEGCALVSELDAFLKDFKRIETVWASDNLSWGDGLYLRIRPSEEANEGVIESGNNQTEEPQKIISESESFFKAAYPAIHKNNPTLTTDICNLMEAYHKEKVGMILESVKEDVKNKFRFDISHSINSYK